MEVTQKEEIKSTDRLLEFDLSAELNHGIAVSNLAYAVAKELGQEEEFCYQLAIAGMLHDIGKLKLTGYINGQERDPLLIEELKYVRMHSTLGYEELRDQVQATLDEMAEDGTLAEIAAKYKDYNLDQMLCLGK